MRARLWVWVRIAVAKMRGRGGQRGVVGHVLASDVVERDVHSHSHWGRPVRRREETSADSRAELSLGCIEQELAWTREEGIGESRADLP